MAKENPLKKVVLIEKKAKKFGFYWGHINELISQIRSECVEIEEAFDSKNKAHLKEEIGDLLLVAASLAIFNRIDPEVALSQSIKKFEKRYKNLQKIVKNDGLKSLKNKPMDVLLEYWQKAKKH